MFTRNTSSEAGRRICLSDATPTLAAPRLRLPASLTHPADSFPRLIYVVGEPRVIKRPGHAHAHLTLTWGI